MAGSNSTSTREKLLGLVDDIELITKEIFENAIAPKVIKVKKKKEPGFNPITFIFSENSNYEQKTLIEA